MTSVKQGLERCALLTLLVVVASARPAAAEARVLDLGSADAANHLFVRVTDRDADVRIGTVTVTASQQRAAGETRAVDVSAFDSGAGRDRFGTVTRTASERQAKEYTPRSGKSLRTVDDLSAPPEVFRSVNGSLDLITNQ